MALLFLKKLSKPILDPFLTKMPMWNSKTFSSIRDFSEMALCCFVQRKNRLSFYEIFPFKFVPDCRFCIWTSYGCITLNMNILPNDYFLNFFILSLMEFPSNLSSYICMNHIGRKISIIGTFLLTALFSTIALFCLSCKLLLDPIRKESFSFVS